MKPDTLFSESNGVQILMRSGPDGQTQYYAKNKTWSTGYFPTATEAILEGTKLGPVWENDDYIAAGYARRGSYMGD
jgi:hypothetical protein